jgi:gluconokinase
MYRLVEENTMILILMGVAGSGKTTIGHMLAQELRWPFYDGDDFHPPTNIDKMSRGIPLTDEDRTAWLTSLRQLIERLLSDRQSAILACSALKQSYRQDLKQQDKDVHFVYLKGDRDLMRQRLKQRSGHFMKANLLASQFETLEEPEGVLTVDAGSTPQAISAAIRGGFSLL